MASLFVPAHPSNYGFRKNRPVERPYDLVVIHCTDGRSRAMPVAEMFAKKRDKVNSAHFVVDQDGTIIQCVKLLLRAKHAGKANSRSVGVEHCARTPGEFERAPYNWAHDPGLPPSSAQYQASAKLVAWLLVAANLPADRQHVRGHAESDPDTTHTRCPDGCGWDWESYMAMVREEREKLLSA